MQNMKTDDLNHKWRTMRSTESGGRLKADVVTAYLTMFLEITDAKHDEFAQVNRKQIVQVSFQPRNQRLNGCARSGSLSAPNSTSEWMPA